jgi:hypothetical protein
VAELAAWLPGRLLDNGDRRQRFIAVMKLGAAGLKSARGCSGYFERNTEFRRKRHLRT